MQSNSWRARRDIKPIEVTESEDNTPEAQSSSFKNNTKKKTINLQSSCRENKNFLQDSVAPNFKLEQPPGTVLHRIRIIKENMVPAVYLNDVLVWTPASITNSPTENEINDLKATVGAIFQDFVDLKKRKINALQSIQTNFPGDKITEFVDNLSRQVCDMNNSDDRKTASSIIKRLIQKEMISKIKFIDILKNGMMKDFLFLIRSKNLAEFLTDIFDNESNLSWLMDLGDNQVHCSHFWIDIARHVTRILKSRLPLPVVYGMFLKTHGFGTQTNE